MSNLRQAAEQALDLMEVTLVNLHGYWRGESEKRITALRAALAELEQNEPLAWFRLDEKTNEAFLVYFPSADGKDWRPLYAMPRRPLTDKELRGFFILANSAEPRAKAWPDLERFARAIERTHGVGEQA